METLAAPALPPGMPRRRLEFAYDAQSRRVRKRTYAWNVPTADWELSETRLFIYDTWNFIAELDGAGAMVNAYTWGLDLSGSLDGAGGVGGLLCVTCHATTTPAAGHFVAYDGNGTALVDSQTAADSATYEYDPFGNTLRRTGPASSANPFRFSTRHFGDKSKLYYYGLRFYSPSLGRWVSRDPIGERGGTNLWAFVSNSPATKYDVLGNVPTPNRWHGNYCGAEKVNGLDMPQTGLRPEDIGPQAPGVPDPFDSADTCCMYHDRCMARVAMSEYPTSNDRNLDKKSCDAQLMVCWSKSLCASDVALVDKLKTVVGIPAFLVAHQAYAPASPDKPRHCCGGWVLFRLAF
jgi:RHS repeat-associated protein